MARKSHRWWYDCVISPSNRSNRATSSFARVIKSYACVEETDRAVQFAGLFTSIDAANRSPSIGSSTLLAIANSSRAFFNSRLISCGCFCSSIIFTRRDPLIRLPLLISNRRHALFETPSASANNSSAKARRSRCLSSIVWTIKCRRERRPSLAFVEWS